MGVAPDVDAHALAAQAYYRRAVASNADLNEAGLSLMRLAGMAMVDGDHRAAVEAFESYRARYPEGRRMWITVDFRDGEITFDFEAPKSRSSKKPEDQEIA